MTHEVMIMSAAAVFQMEGEGLGEAAAVALVRGHGCMPRPLHRSTASPPLPVKQLILKSPLASLPLVSSPPQSVRRSFREPITR